MSAQQTAITLKEILLSISDSLNDAQNELRNMPPYDEFGRPNILYTLPYLDFDIKVEASTESTSRSHNTSQEAPPQHFRRTINSNASSGEALNPVLANVKPDKLLVNKKIFWQLKPNYSSSSSSANSNKLTSSISGRFVAVPPNEGLPQIYLQETVSKVSDTIFELEIFVGNSAGEKIPGTKVEINFVPEESDDSVSPPRLSVAEVYTSALEGPSLGSTEPVTITISSSDVGKNIVFEINVGPISKLISLT